MLVMLKRILLVLEELLVYVFLATHICEESILMNNADYYIALDLSDPRVSVLRGCSFFSVNMVLDLYEAFCM